MSSPFEARRQQALGLACKIFILRACGRRKLNFSRLNRSLGFSFVVAAHTCFEAYNDRPTLSRSSLFVDQLDAIRRTDNPGDVSRQTAVDARRKVDGDAHRLLSVDSIDGANSVRGCCVR